MSGEQASRPPAVVAGLDLNGLGVVRSLARGQVPIVALDTDLKKPEAATRFGRKIRVSALSGEAFVQELCRVRQRFDSDPVLILTQEASVATLSATRDRLAHLYRFTLSAPSVTEDLLDKTRFQMLAEKHGFPVPRSVVIRDPDGAAPASGLRFPCVLKPTTKHPGYAKKFAKAYKVTSLSEVDALWSSMRDIVDEVIVQEWIEGAESNIFFCLQYRGRDRPPASFVGRKICQWPPFIGGTASCVPAPEVEAELTAMTNEFFDAVGFVGIGSMEYKRDSRDGAFYMVEPTVGRTDYQEGIAALNGANIPLAAYLGEAGAPPPLFRKVTPPRAWRDPDGYAKARLAGSPDPMREITGEVKVCDAYFQANDPMPYLALKFQAVRRRFA